MEKEAQLKTPTVEMDQVDVSVTGEHTLDTEKNFDMKTCSDAIEECAELENDNAYCDADDIDVEDEYDEEHLKEIFDKLSEEQLEAKKKQSIELKNDGNDKFRKNNYLDAINLYTQALNNCPLQFQNERSILYANRAAALVGLDKKEEAIKDCNKALELNPDYFKVTLRRAQLHRKLNNLDQSLEDYKKVLEMDRDNREAMQACATLPGEINERNEKLKTEMLGKLKDLGNLVLRPFGLSTNNFNVVQDPTSGGYSINFQNNPK